MTKFKTILILLAMIFAMPVCLQAGDFSVQEYRNFLEQNENLSSPGFFGMYPAGIYERNAVEYNSPLYLDSMKMKMEMTEDELDLLDRHGFVVTERKSYKTMWEGMKEIYFKDLPIIITTDMMLHALHMSYDAILKDIERQAFIPQMEEALREMRQSIGKRVADPVMMQSYNDVDIYLTIALDLLVEEDVEPMFNENKATVDEIMELIEAEQQTSYGLFQEKPRKLDFSQFTVRGHYTDSKELGRYFQSMIWLGRTELYLIPPDSYDCKPSPEDVRRQIIDAAIITELAEKSGAAERLNAINTALESLVGKSDNVQMKNITDLREELGIADVTALTDMNTIEKFQETLAEKSYAGQKILSQILMSDPFSLDQIEPASAFMLMGQRFIIDSYISANVVYDKIVYNGTKVRRMLPSHLDILFALGNNAAGDLLKEELDNYHYHKNLSGLRYLIDSYGEDFWTESFYACWLNSIRGLNPKADEAREELPEFMQTAAWWQQKMNTQLSSWAQLRHDNLLYAKQSYTGGVSCDYPYGYVEPAVEFYAALETLSDMANTKLLASMDKLAQYEDMQYIRSNVRKYFENMQDVAGKLRTISEKEIKGEKLTDSETEFILSVYQERDVVCAVEPSGWYADLYYFKDVEKPDYVVADVHTAPTDAAGNMVGWVWHVGTGPINLMIVRAKDYEGREIAYAGPVLSFYEHVSTNFKRLTDEEWEQSYQMSHGLRPDWTELYLADKDGHNSVANPPMLPTGATEVDRRTEGDIGMTIKPNPMVESSMIVVKLPGRAELYDVDLSIYDMNGRKVAAMFNGSVNGGNYLARWDGTTDTGFAVENGIYVIKLSVGDRVVTGKIAVSK